MFKGYKILITFLFISPFSFGQIPGNFQMTIKPGSQPTSVYAVVKPAATDANREISSVQATFLIPTSVGPRPTATLLNNFYPQLTYVLYQSTETTVDGTWYTYTFDGSGVASSATYTGNTEYNILEIGFSGISSVSNFRVAQLPNGGVAGDAPGNYNFYFALNGVDVVNQTAQFYGPSSSNDGAGYAGYSYAQIASTLPVSWLGFTAEKQNTDALLKWLVTNERDNDHYELERSLDGRTFNKIADIANLPGSGDKEYSHVDQNIVSLNSNILHYRVKQIDINGRFSYSPIRTLRIDINGQISIHPNPVKKGFTLNVPFVTPGNRKLGLHLVNATGQVIDKREITEQQASGYYYDIQLPGVISGNYLLRIYSNNSLLATKKIVIDR